MTFLFMEFTANMAHRYLMHGLMWYFHSDHHKKEAGFFEKNDIFFLIFAIPAMILTMGGFFLENYYSLAVGLGITAYGFAYFWVHEVYIHRRLKLFDNVDNFYFQALNRAHKDHHSQLEKEDAQNFGMLWVPLKYFKNANN
ncbi:MAG: sterol desaturase family protein [Candidatus Caenarcaniphilales bacterium]|nr:sterol desaturase family protein [Candidatus Caenarcaniphilales bacterium]